MFNRQISLSARMRFSPIYIYSTQTVENCDSKLLQVTFRKYPSINFMSYINNEFGMIKEFV